MHRSFFRPLIRRLSVVSVCVVSGTCVAVAAGQPAKPAPAAAGAPAAPDPLVGMTGRAVTRVALTDLKVSAAPAPEDFRVAAALLAIAHEHLPNDLDILRLEQQAALEGGETAKVDELTRAILRLDPGDTVAQLALVSARLKRIQDVEGRLSAYEQLLGRQGQSLDPSVRSRLALDDALLLRERGDAAGFVRRLSDAVKLDQTNKDAAALAATFFMAQRSDPQGRVELMLNLLNADPFDSDTYIMLAREMAASGASRAAARFYRNATSLMSKQGGSPDPALSAALQTQNWLVQGAEPVIKDLNAAVGSNRDQLQALRDQMTKNGQSVKELQEPSSIRLAVDVDVVRGMAALGIDDGKTVDDSLTDIAGSIEQWKAWLAGKETLPKRPASLSDDRARQLVATWEPELASLRLLANKQVDLAAKQIEAFHKEGGLSGAQLARLDAWLKLRTGDKAGAIKALSAAADADPLSALGLAVNAEAEGKKEEAIDRYATISRAVPGTAVAGFCRARAAKLSGKEPALPALAEKLEAMAVGVPAWYDEAINDPRKFMTLTASVDGTQFGPLDPVFITIRIRNVSPIPLAAGAEEPINTRLLVSPVLETATKRLVDEAAPEVILLSRQLRLMPRDEISATVWADPGYGGWALSYAQDDNIRVRWRVLQGFQLVNGVADAGALCLATDAGEALRTSLSGTSSPPAVLVSDIAAAKGKDLAQPLAVARMKLMSVGKEGFTADLATKLAEALAARYAAGTADERILMLCSLPTAVLAPAMAPFDKAVRETNDTDSGVLLVKLVTRAVDANDPIVAACRASSDKEVAAIAELRAKRLSTKMMTYSRLATTHRMAGDK